MQWLTHEELAQAYRQFMSWRDVDAYMRLYEPAISASDSEVATHLTGAYIVLHAMKQAKARHIQEQVRWCAELIFMYERENVGSKP